MIKVENASKSFAGSMAIEDICLSIHKGSIYGLIGSNGAGKTTLIKLLAGIYLQDQGVVTIDGETVFENTGLKERFFYIPDQPYFFSQYTAKQMAHFYKSVYRAWSDERFRLLAQSFGLDVNKKLHSFSKGWQRQAAFILALSAKPEFLILDEPMDGMDPVVRKRVKNILIQDVAEREMTILMSSHNLREVEDICDHIGMIHQGRMIFEKDLDELKEDIHKIQVAYNEGVPEQLLDNLNILHTEKRGSVHLYIVRGEEAEVVKNIRRSNPIIFDMLPLTLEEIFIYEMGDIGYAIENIVVK
ncbi:ABC transporter ATP-binding protein [Bacillus benzoevorans]|uniref:ABC-2 type transport system ATP-binding protein n=1 Tax=Bacillus benzoevorans TaxID=1456 RepID=A0A7X0HXE3_9BACI|nr:ABC transporter ATP-binding protein [Bacillus benzoevorans]MBB6447737.1 ABC-2 type transport system ATP-binding protein [Bacillus benzoevorans]